MPNGYRKNRAMERILRDKFRNGAAPKPVKKEAAGPLCVPSYSLPDSIPENYNDSYVRAIPKDPRNTFVYWEMPKEVTRPCVFPDKGTAHVESGEAERVREQLNFNHHPWHDNNGHRPADNYWQDGDHCCDDNQNRQNAGGAAQASAFSMIDNLIDQCCKYVKQNQSDQYQPSPSSGMFCNTNADRRP